MNDAKAMVSRPVGWSGAESTAYIYISLPFVVFLLGWLAQPLGGGCAALYLWASWRFLHGVGSDWTGELSWPVVIGAAAIALAWASMGGAGHFFYANPFDWGPRFALARDLVVAPWPVSYLQDADELLLRAPLGYYLVPSLIAKMVGLERVDLLLFGWTVLGVMIFFLVAFPRAGLGRLMLAIVAFILASGGDVLGYVEDYWSWPVPGEHIEWWAKLWQYSSNTTLLFWVPNHALAAWIATALLLRQAKDREVLGRGIPLLLAPLALWSPLSAVGILPIILVALAQWRFDREFCSLLLRVLLVCLMTGLPVILYLTHGIETIPGTSIGFRGGTDSDYFPRMIWFLMVEIGFLAALLVASRPDALHLASIAFLLVLPLFGFGGGNDLVMRASIPALTVLWIGLIDRFVLMPEGLGRRQRTAFVLTCLSIGSVTPLQEMIRAITMPRWAPDTRLSLPGAFSRIADRNPFPPHYFTRIDPADLLERALPRTRHPIVYVQPVQVDRR